MTDDINLLHHGQFFFLLMELLSPPKIQKGVLVPRVYPHPLPPLNLSQGTGQMIFYVKYKDLKRGYINLSFMTFSDLELSFWFELRYLKSVFCKM